MKDLLNERILEINCQNVIISKKIKKSRFVNMDCYQGKNNLFILKADLNEDFNVFRGKIKNFNPNFIFYHVTIFSL